MRREDQVRTKQDKKAQHGTKTKGKKNGKKAKKAKNGNRNGKKKSQADSCNPRGKAARRRAVLKVSPKKRPEPEDQNQEPDTAKKATRKKPRATAEPEAVAPKSKSRPRAKAAAKSNPKAKAKPASKKKNMPAPESKRPRTRRAKTAQPTEHEPEAAQALEAELDQALLDSILGFVSKISLTDSMDEVKRQVKFHLSSLWHFKLNVYWNRPSCGVTILPNTIQTERVIGGNLDPKNPKSKDFGYFDFREAAPPNTSKALLMVIAVRCAELAVSSLLPSGIFPFFSTNTCVSFNIKYHIHIISLSSHMPFDLPRL